MYRWYEENTNDKNKNVEFRWETTKFKALFLSELHLKTMVLDFRVKCEVGSSFLGPYKLCQSKVQSAATCKSWMVRKK